MIKKSIKFLIAFILIMVLSDIYIRFTGAVSLSNTDYYNDIGKSYRANFTSIYFNEGYSIRTVNKYRYWGKAYPEKKEKNTIRIALLGDSYIEGIQVFERNHLRTIIENTLNQNCNTDIKYEVLNFGMSGLNLGYMYAYQKEFVDKFNPDLYLYFVSEDDIFPEYNDPIIIKTLLKGDSLILNKVSSKKHLSLYKKTKILFQNSSIFAMLNNCRKQINGVGLTQLIFKSKMIQKKQNTLIKNTPIPKLVSKILENNNNKKTIYVWRDKSEMNNNFINLLNKNNLKYIDLSHVLKKMEKEGNNPNYWTVTKKEGHWNINAHKLIGKKIANDIIFCKSNINK